MFNKLIVGVDGRDGGRDALALALVLAADDAEIHAVHAYPFDHHPSRLTITDYESALRAEAQELLATHDGDPRIERWAVPDTSPARALQRFAAEHDADVVVLGPAHRGAVGRVLLGDVSRGVVHGAPCAVAIAPRGYREDPHPIRVVGVGVDEGDASLAAADFAGALAAEQGADVRMVTVIRGPMAFAPGYAYAYDWPALAETSDRAARELQGRIAEAMAAEHVQATGAVSEGVPATALERLSQEVDLLVLGSRGWGAVRRVVLGSTADRVAHRAASPVLLVPAPPARETAQPLEEAKVA